METIRITTLATLAGYWQTEADSGAGNADRREVLRECADVLRMMCEARFEDCPHAAPHRYCAQCPVSPCPIGLGPNASGPCPKPPLLQPHQMRVVAEKIELDKKANALSGFIAYSPIFETLDAAEQERLKEQNDVMWQYSEILGARIAAFSA